MVSIIGLLVTRGAIIFIDALDHIMIESGTGLPAGCFMTIAATCSKVGMKCIGRLLVTGAAIIEDGCG